MSVKKIAILSIGLAGLAGLTACNKDTITHDQNIGEFCSPEQQCQDGLICGSDSICYKICNTKADCSPKEICFNSQCIQNQKNTCSNGIVEAGEVCDDGNTINGDGCSNICQIEPGFSCEIIDETSYCKKTCGNRQEDPGEECDDGNNRDSDGCSSICKIEKNYTCTGWPSKCECSAGFQDRNKDGVCNAECPVCKGDYVCNYNIDGTAQTCKCPDGLQDEDGDGKCLPDYDCNSTQDKKYTAAGEAYCDCKEGLQDNNNDGYCEDDCSTFLAQSGCPAFSSCNDESGTATCECTVYVKAGATGNGSSWDNATGTVDSAIIAAQTLLAQNNSCSIWIDKNVNEVLKNTIDLKNINLYGGFDGESLIQQRQESNHSTLSGDKKIRIANIQSNIVLDGIDFVNGSATSSNNSKSFGGALSGSNIQNIQINNCSFKNNNANSNGNGGAIYLLSSYATITNSTFTENSANISGGAIYFEESTITIDNCSFISNKISNDSNAYGGAIYLNKSDLELKNSFFHKNYSTGYNAAFGGAIYSFISKLTANSCQFDSNHAYTKYDQSGGGAIYTDSENGEADSDGALVIEECDFFNNYLNNEKGEARGGTIYNSTDGASINASRFLSSSFAAATKACANAYGGVLFNKGRNVIFTNNFISDISLSNGITGCSGSTITGGAVYNDAAATMAIAYSAFNRITTNGASGTGGCVNVNIASNINISNSLLSGGYSRETISTQKTLQSFKYSTVAPVATCIKVTNDTVKGTTVLNYNDTEWEPGELVGKMLYISSGSTYSKTLPIRANTNKTITIPLLENNSFTSAPQNFSITIFDYSSLLDNKDTQTSFIDKGDGSNGPQPENDIMGRPRIMGAAPDIGPYEFQ